MLDSVDKNIFWPVKIDENSIALRSRETNKFCQRLTTTADYIVHGLSASSATITNEAIMEVQELVRVRKIYTEIQDGVCSDFQRGALLGRLGHAY